jgi:RND family efflux transporter MFP subunit
VDLRARVNGYLRQIEFTDGAMVQEGDLLFVIEQAPYKNALARAEADLQKAQAALQLAQAQFDRSEQLARRNATSPQEVDVQRAELASAKADVAGAQASLKTATLNLEYTEIHAPITGRIGRRLIDIGNLVQTEQTLLATIESVDPVYAEFHVSESDLLRMTELVREEVMPDPRETPPELFLQLGADAETSFRGHLDFQATSVDPSTGTILRRGIFDNPTGELSPGMFVRIRAPLGEPKPKLTVEQRALGADQRGDFVLVVNKENVVEYRPVKLGIAKEGWRVVEDGLKDGEWIVVNGLQRARPGATVDPERPAGETQTATAESKNEGSASKGPQG